MNVLLLLYQLASFNDAVCQSWVSTNDTETLLKLSSSRSVEWYFHGKSRILMCGIPKVGITNMEYAQFYRVNFTTLKALLSEVSVIPIRTSVMVRSPFDRFLSFYNNKIKLIASMNGSDSHLKTKSNTWVYNELLLTKNGMKVSSKPKPPWEYAVAIWKQGAAGLERHIRTMTRACLLDCVPFDMIADLQDTEVVERALGSRWPHVHSNSNVDSALVLSDLDCITRELIYQAYVTDFEHLIAQPNAPRIIKAYKWPRCGADDVLSSLSQHPFLLRYSFLTTNESQALRLAIINSQVK